MSTQFAMAVCHIDVMCQNGWLGHGYRGMMEGLGLPTFDETEEALHNFTNNSTYEAGRKAIENGIREVFQLKGWIQ